MCREVGLDVGTGNKKGRDTWQPIGNWVTPTCEGATGKETTDVVFTRWATDWMIGVLGFDSWRRLGIFLFTTASRRALGPTQPPIQWPSRALSLGVK